MIPVLPGLIVARALPLTTLAGLATGAYTLHGGVIRHAAGTGRGRGIPVCRDPPGVVYYRYLPLSHLTLHRVSTGRTRIAEPSGGHESREPCHNETSIIMPSNRR